MLLLGANSPTQGYTDRAKAAAALLGPGVMLWNSSAEPTNAEHAALNIVRCDNWGADESSANYLIRISPTINRWIAAPNVVFQLGNEPDLEAGHRGERIQEMADAVHHIAPWIKVGNPPLSVENTHLMRADHCDYVLCHAYFERQHPEDIDNPQFGASYVHALAQAAGRPVIVTEFNVVQTNSGVDWPDRNRLVAQWLDNAEAHGVAGICLFILDASPDWATFDIGPEAVIDILNRRGHDPVPIPVPPPTPPPPVPPPTPTGVYTRSTNPTIITRPFARQAWIDYLSRFNSAEAEQIVAIYEVACATIGIDANCAIAQGCVETANFTSARWRAARNAAGIGIYADSTPDVNFRTISRGIRAQVELLSDYFGDGSEPWGILHEYGFGGMVLHKTTLSGMDGVWAADLGYSAAIVGVLNLIFGGGVIVAPTWVSGEAVIAQAMLDLGHDTFLDEGITVPSYFRCEEAVEVWEERCGLSRLRYFSARTDADSSPLNSGVAPIGARVFFRGPGWSDFDHVGHALGDGRTISALTVVSIKDGWQDPAVGYIGWRYAPGVGPGSVTPKYRKMRVPAVMDGFDEQEIQRLWYGTAKPTKTMLDKFPYNKTFGVEQSYVQLANGTFDQPGQDYTGLSIILGQCISKEEEDTGTPGRSVRYFANGKITALKSADGKTYAFRLN